MADFNSQSFLAEISEGWTVRACVCGRCGHRWIAETLADPRACPRCHNVGWNKPVTRPDLVEIMRKRWKKTRRTLG